MEFPTLVAKNIIAMKKSRSILDEKT